MPFTWWYVFSLVAGADPHPGVCEQHARAGLRVRGAPPKAGTGCDEVSDHQKPVWARGIAFSLLMVTVCGGEHSAFGVVAGADFYRNLVR